MGDSRRNIKTPQSTRRHLSSTSNPSNPAAPLKTPTPPRVPREKHFISTPFSTIEARARSFQGQVLNGVTPLELARAGFYYEPNAPFSDIACCFACQAFVRLGSLQHEPLQERQRLHVNDCVWEVIYNELKLILEPTDKLPPPATAPPPPIQSTPNHRPTSDVELLKQTTTDASTQTPTRPTRTTPAAREEPANTSIDSCAKPPPATTDQEQSTTPPNHSPDSPQPITTITSSPRNQQTTYASVLQQSPASPSESTSPTQEPIIPAKPVLTIEDLHRRFHNKPSPFQIGKKTSRHRTRNKNVSATQSLSKFLASALPAFSRFLREMQPKSDNCYPSHPRFYYSRATRAA
ncbi:uncharacterized protein N7473_001700 [Penicillium subrubescens]|uniref:uncharacterized protein n=1 Tax=Penicillium subrubescens TaxID=1316194 RepID=UPI002545B955|nr:uncharacterized protein N7473_001700 [Penicillium subrubescens]KAJ5904784.1 hypothetical protein N7473_001700 [Penicillium subrubescens]